MVDTKTKKHKVSKKTKKSWRKHIDIKDVDAFFDNKKLQERLGVPFAKERANSQLFIDIWDTTNNILPETITEWMSSDSIRHMTGYLGVKKSTVPSSLHKKSSILPAIEIPHPGTSYNPAYTDHQELLHSVVQNELELTKQEEHLNRVTTQMFKKIPLDKRDEYMMKEISEGLPTKNQAIVNLEFDKKHDKGEDSPVILINSKPVKNIKKTLVQKRKQREQKHAFNERIWAKSEKKKISDVYKLKFLQKQIEAEEKKQELLRQKRMKKRERESVAPKTLSKIKFEPLDLDFQLAEELTGNLRNCKPSKNLLKERYKSLQQRNIIAPTLIKLKQDKAKVKKFVKSDHKINLDDAKLRFYRKKI